MANVERCYCWDCGGWGKVEYEEPRPDPIVGGELVSKVGHCHTCDGIGEKYRAKITQTTVIRAFLTQAKHALEDIELTDSDLDQIYTTVDGAIGGIERYARKVCTRDG